MTSSRSRSYARLGLVPTLAVALVLGVLALGAPAQAQKIKPNFFGIHDARIGSGGVPGVEVGSTRLWDTGTSWRQIETSDGVFDWTVLDRAVSTAEAAGLRPMLVLGQTPRFHATKPNAPGAYGDGASSMPKMAAWQRYVGAVASRYGNRLDYQVWNEPNVVNYWTGSVAQMAKLTATAGKKIRGIVGKKATVVAPAFPLRLKGQRTWFDKFWSAKVNRKPVSSFVKVVAVNLYPEPKQAPEAQLKLLKFAKKALPKSARRKPMWNTEINYGLLGGAPAKQIGDAKQASYVARTLVLNAASPIKRMYWYRWIVGTIANTHLVENDATTLTRAGRAWGVTHGWINQANVSKCSKAKRGKLKGLWTCVAKQGRGDVRRIYWKPAGKAERVRTHRTTFAWTNLAGVTTAKRGRFTLKVGQLPVMVNSRD